MTALSFILSPRVAPILLLCLSNLFMTTAWYGHLKFTDRPLWLVVLASWGIALVEYCFAVPANRYGHQAYSAAELKTMQEIITLAVFAIFSVGSDGALHAAGHVGVEGKCPRDIHIVGDWLVSANQVC